jgi:hypothetical protein
MSGGIDYSKWDNFSDSDDGSNADDHRQFHDDDGDNRLVSGNSFPSTTASTLSGDHSPAEIGLLKRGVSYEKEEKSNSNGNDEDVGWLLVGPCKNIRVHPNDNSTSMYSSIIFTEDPNTYVPDRSKYDDDCVLKWGIEPPEPSTNESDDDGDGGILKFMSRIMMQSSNSSMEYYKHHLENPEVQFIDILIGRRSK